MMNRNIKHTHTPTHISLANTLYYRFLSVYSLYKLCCSSPAITISCAVYQALSFHECIHQHLSFSLAGIDSILGNSRGWNNKGSYDTCIYFSTQRTSLVNTLFYRFFISLFTVHFVVFHRCCSMLAMTISCICPRQVYCAGDSPSFHEYIPASLVSLENNAACYSFHGSQTIAPVSAVVIISS
jgi:hypothetical protein